MPIFLLPGNTGDLLVDAISVVMALIGSLFISLTIIAALAACFTAARAATKAVVSVAFCHQRQIYSSIVGVDD